MEKLSSLERSMDVYGSQIGRHRAEVTTPALLLDLDAVERNCAAMAKRFVELPASLRPHSKAHKFPKLSQMEIATGAIGITCATIWEAETMAAAGIEDILIANQIIQPDKVRILANLAADHRLTVAADDVDNVVALDRAAALAGAQIEVLVEVDLGMGRAGVRSFEDALHVAQAVADSAHLVLRGLQGYEGHCMIEDDHDIRAEMARTANAKLIAAADYLADHGLECGVLSGGGTGTYAITGSNPRINEVQAGSYLLMDVFHERMIPGEFEPALTVLGSVVSQKGRTAVLDAGRKVIGIDYVMPKLVTDIGGTVRSVAEEHSAVDFDGDSPLRLGATVEIFPSYAPTTVNLNEMFHVIQSDVVVDVWPIGPRPRMATSSPK
jgi:D-serine deaminase-like pyridoxal phosphate-dependent protein